MELDLQDRDQQRAEELAEALAVVAWVEHDLVQDPAAIAFAPPAEM